MLKDRIEKWFKAYGKQPSILVLPDLMRDHLLEGEEKDANIHLNILPEYMKIPKFQFSSIDILVFYYIKERRLVIRWHKTRCVFNAIKYESFEEVQKELEYLKELEEEEMDEGEFGFGGDWWKE